MHVLVAEAVALAQSVANGEAGPAEEDAVGMVVLELGKIAAEKLQLGKGKAAVEPREICNSHPRPNRASHAGVVPLSPPHVSGESVPDEVCTGLVAAAVRRLGKELEAGADLRGWILEDFPENATQVIRDHSPASDVLVQLAGRQMIIHQPSSLHRPCYSRRSCQDTTQSTTTQPAGPGNQDWHTRVPSLPRRLTSCLRRSTWSSTSERPRSRR